jgi:hypothetical protein
VIARGLLTGEECRAWKAEAHRILGNLTAEAEAKGEPRPRFWRTGVYVGLSIASDVFRRMNRDPRLLDLLEPIIGPNLLFWSDKVVFKGESADYGTPWHQDWAYWKGVNKFSVWIALDEATVENGCLRLLPGSHRRFHDPGEKVAGEAFSYQVDRSSIDESRAITFAAKPGDAVAFHDLLLHASYPNASRADRWALITTFKDPLADDLDYPAMTAAAVVRGRGRPGTSDAG